MKRSGSLEWTLKQVQGDELIFHPPRRKTPRLARLVEEDDVAVGVAQPCFAPHPGLVARAVLKRDPAPREQLDPLVEVVALEIDRGRRDDLLFRVDLDRESDSAGRLEPRIVWRVIDDLLE